MLLISRRNARHSIRRWSAPVRGWGRGRMTVVGGGVVTRAVVGTADRRIAVYRSADRRADGRAAWERRARGTAAVVEVGGGEGAIVGRVAEVRRADGRADGSAYGSTNGRVVWRRDIAKRKMFTAGVFSVCLLFFPSTPVLPFARVVVR